MDDVITTEHILSLVSRQKTLNFEPGSQFQYSNTGYTLLAEIVARVSGQTLAQFTGEQMFQTLGMYHTQFYDEHEKIVKNRAYAYALEAGVYQKKKLNYATVGATSLFSTVEDLAKWTRNFEQTIVGDAELLRRFNEGSFLDTGEPAILTVMDGETIYHAKGQFFRDHRGLKLYNHTGGDAGFRSYLVRFPEQQFSIVLLSNERDFDRLGKGLAIAEIFLKDELKEKPIHQHVQNKVQQANPPFNGNFQDVNDTYYSEELATFYQLEKKGHQLSLSHIRVGEIPFTQVGTDHFSGKIWFEVRLDIMRNQQKEVVGFELSSFGAKKVWFTKI